MSRLREIVGFLKKEKAARLSHFIGHAVCANTELNKAEELGVVVRKPKISDDGSLRYWYFLTGHEHTYEVKAVLTGNNGDTVNIKISGDVGESLVSLIERLEIETADTAIVNIVARRM